MTYLNYNTFLNHYSTVLIPLSAKWFQMPGTGFRGQTQTFETSRLAFDSLRAVQRDKIPHFQGT